MNYDYLQTFSVLIVAKCIVNLKIYMDVEESQAVLIVAKCIVNTSILQKKSFPISY